MQQSQHIFLFFILHSFSLSPGKLRRYSQDTSMYVPSCPLKSLGCHVLFFHTLLSSVSEQSTTTRNSVTRHKHSHEIPFSTVIWQSGWNSPVWLFLFRVYGYVEGCKICILCFLDHRPHSKSRRTTSLSPCSYIFLIRLLSAIINRVFEYQNVKERSCGVQKFLVAVGGRLSVCIVHDLLKFLGNSAWRISEGTVRLILSLLL